jgi:threonine/homoserine/homoserine lactone efflux protein
MRAGFLVTAANPKELIVGIAAGVVTGSATLPFGMVAAAVLSCTAIAHHRGGARIHGRSHDRQRPRRLLVVVHVSVDARCS